MNGQLGVAQPVAVMGQCVWVLGPLWLCYLLMWRMVETIPASSLWNDSNSSNICNSGHKRDAGCFARSDNTPSTLIATYKPCYRGPCLEVLKYLNYSLLSSKHLTSINYFSLINGRVLLSISRSLDRRPLGGNNSVLACRCRCVALVIVETLKK